jgi:hypothetical protein
VLTDTLHIHAVHACTVHTALHYCTAHEAGKAALAVTQMAVTAAQLYRRAERGLSLLQEALVFVTEEGGEAGMVLAPVLQEGTDLSTRRYFSFFHFVLFFHYVESVAVYMLCDAVSCFVE